MPPFRILLIDPDTTSSKYIQSVLTKEGFEVFVADTTTDGLLEAYQNRPHVIVLDPVFPVSEIQGLISKSRKDWRLSRSAIIAFSSLSNTSEIQHAMDLDFDRFITKESHALPELVSACMELSEQARRKTVTESSESRAGAPQSEPRKSDGKSIVFLATKGGVGTTSLCANIAHITGQMLDKPVAVVDLVLPIGSLEFIVGAHDSVNLVEVSQLSQQTEISEKLRGALQKPRNWNFGILAGSASPEESERLEISRVPLIMDSLKEMADYTFIDIGKSLSRVTLPIILSADMIVLTLSLDKTTVEQTKTIWEFLQKKGVASKQVYFLINRAVSLEGLNKSEVEEILGTVIQLAVPYMGRNFTLANNLNEPLSDKFPQDAVTLSLRQASEEIVQKIETNKGSMAFF